MGNSRECGNYSETSSNNGIPALQQDKFPNRERSV